MVTILQAFILGIIQGITEWLPISSSGHLALIQYYFDIEVPIAFDVLLHIGTALVILFVFWKDIWMIIKSIWDKDYKKYRPMLLYIIIGSFFTGVIGIFGKEYISELFYRPSSIGAALLVTSALLFGSKYYQTKRKEISIQDSIVIGIMQGMAIIPGISRSGATIATGLMRGLDRTTATTFSFLLLLPAVLGATILEYSEFISSDIPVMASITGMLTAIIVGYGSLKILLKLVQDNRFHYLGWYCLILGMIIVAL